MEKYVLNRYEYTEDKIKHSYTIKEGIKPMNENDKLKEKINFTYLEKGERVHE